VHVLRNMVEAVKPGGHVFDLQVIRPNPTVEVDGQAVCEIGGEPLFRSADAATDAVDALVRTRQLVEQAVDDHHVRKHYDNGAELVDDFADKQRTLPDQALPQLRRLAQPCVVRERCRLRRLEVR
jgi:2-polyprenyl-3-methyl-5-hydroxy-6-metoxy-1,4-benzoquinol methylase